MHPTVIKKATKCISKADCTKTDAQIGVCMKFYRNIKLLWKLIILVLVTGTIPLYVVTLTTHFSEKALVIKEINAKNELYSQTLASRLETFISEKGITDIDDAVSKGISDEMKYEISRNSQVIGTTAAAYVIDSNGNLVIPGTSGIMASAKPSEKADNPAAEAIKKAIAAKLTDTAYSESYKNREGTEVLSYATVFKISDVPYGIIIEVDYDDALQEISSSNGQFALLLTIVAIFAFAIAVYDSLTISRPLNRIAASISKIADADLSEHIDSSLLERKDEVGDLGRAVENVSGNLKGLIATIKGKAEELNSASEKLNESSRQAAHTAEDISNSVIDIAQTATKQAQDTDSGVRNLGKLDGIIAEESSAIDLVGQAMNMVKDNVNEGLNVIDRLSEKNKKSIEASSIVQQAVKNTSECAKKISQASTFIASIAGQTNLLSLNASIEAARAGEAGRGFAVVASEIQKLAEESTESTQNIDTIISEILKTIDVAVKKTNESTDMLEEQTEIVDSTAEKFRLIAKEAEGLENAVSVMDGAGRKVKNTSTEVIEVINELARMAEQNAAITEEVSASVEEQGAMVEEIETTSEILLQISRTLEGEISKFKV